MNKAILIVVTVLVLMVAFTLSRSTIFAPKQAGPDETISLEPKVLKSAVPAPNTASGWFSHADPRSIIRYRDNAFTQYTQELEEKSQAATEIQQDMDRYTQAMGGLAGRCYQEGLGLLADGKYEDAVSAFIKALKAEPNNKVIRLLSFKRMAAAYKILNKEKRYCVATIKYLEILIEIEQNPNQQENIRNFKNQIAARMESLPDE